MQWLGRLPRAPQLACGTSKTDFMAESEFMKRASYYLIGLTWLVAPCLWAETPTRGSLLELHSCELYAGGCVVSSEATQCGRYMLRAWSFSQGSSANEKLAGLQFAVLEASSENLAVENAAAEQAVVYLPQHATADQRDALLSWLRANAPELKHATLKSRVVPIELRDLGTGYALSAGQFISVQTAPLESCPMGSCGESLWYIPRMTTSEFTVAVDSASRVEEPLLKLKWIDAGKRSVFLAKFGEPGTGKDTYVTSADVCGAMTMQH